MPPLRVKKYGSVRIERQKFWRRMRIYGIMSGVMLLLILIAYVFIGSSLFKIKTFAVEGIDPIYHQRIISSLALQVVSQPFGGLLGSDNYFAWDSDLAYATPQVSSVEIDKSLFGHTLVVTVAPRQRYAVWCLRETSEEEVPPCYWIDQTGLAFELAPLTEGQLLLTVHDDATNLTRGDRVLESNQFEVVQKILGAMLEQHIGIRKITIDRSLQELHVNTLRGTRIMMSLRFDPEPTAIPAIAKFMENPGLDKLEYLNLTVENRAFLKHR